MRFTRSFTEHPASAGETYLEHMGVALGFARALGGAAMAAAVHAVFPTMFETTASERIRRLNHCLETGDRDAIRHPRRERVEPRPSAAAEREATRPHRRTGAPVHGTVIR